MPGCPYDVGGNNSVRALSIGFGSRSMNGMVLICSLQGCHSGGGDGGGEMRWVFSDSTHSSRPVLSTLSSSIGWNDGQ